MKGSFDRSELLFFFFSLCYKLPATTNDLLDEWWPLWFLESFPFRCRTSQLFSSRQFYQEGRKEVDREMKQHHKLTLVLCGIWVFTLLYGEMFAFWLPFQSSCSWPHLSSPPTSTVILSFYFQQTFISCYYFIFASLHK